MLKDRTLRFMSFTERLGDAVGNRKEERGTISLNPGELPPPTITGILLRWLIAIPLLYLYSIIVKESFSLHTWKQWTYAIYGLGVYLFFAFFIRPHPGSYFGRQFYRYDRNEYSYDDPYTTADDLNNFLLVMKVFFFPGVIICEAVLDPFRLILRWMFPAWYGRKK